MGGPASLKNLHGIVADIGLYEPLAGLVMSHPKSVSGDPYR
jgi:hypothetical protein